MLFLDFPAAATDRISIFVKVMAFRVNLSSAVCASAVIGFSHASLHSEAAASQEAAAQLY
jgi:hypothetical protein